MYLIWDHDLRLFFPFVLQTLYLFVVLYAPSLALEAGETLNKFNAVCILVVEIIRILVSLGPNRWTVGIDQA